MRFALVSLLLLLTAGPAGAFHSGGVADCEGCHSIHNSSEGTGQVAGQGQNGPNLLRGADSSSVCLNCHESTGGTTPQSYLVSTPSSDLLPGRAPRHLSPGGDFGWLKKTYSWVPSPGATELTSSGDRHGHNVVAADHGYLPDATYAVAPGGTYPSASLGCVSCHDPHGRYRRLPDGSVATTGLPTLDTGSHSSSPDPVPGYFAVGVYRLLGGVGYRPTAVASGLGFASPPPDAVAPADYNRSEAVTQTRVAYGRGMSEWCANCHPAMLRGGFTEEMGSIRHPVGNEARLPGAVVTNYVAYVKTGVIGNVDATRAYLSLVPFEEGTSDYAILKGHARTDDSFLDGPTSVSTVTCLSCHRAHASGFDAILRYRVGNSFITVADGTGAAAWPDPLTAPAEAQGRMPAETQQSYYGRPASAFAAFQTSLCNKCHVKE